MINITRQLIEEKQPDLNIRTFLYQLLATNKTLKDLIKKDKIRKVDKLLIMHSIYGNDILLLTHCGFQKEANELFDNFVKASEKFNAN